MGLLRLAQLTGEQRYERHGAGVIALLHDDRAASTQPPSGICCRRCTGTWLRRAPDRLRDPADRRPYRIDR